MNRAVFGLLALGTLLGPCDTGPSGIVEGVVQGTWGGDNAGLIADDTSAHVHIGCTYGQVHQPIVPDAAGRFDVPGEQNITAYPVDLGVLHPARFSGRIASGRMSLTVALTDTTVTLGPVQLAYGKEPKMQMCPICRRPGGGERMAK